MRKIFPLILLSCLAAIAIPQNAPTRPGKMPDGRIMLPSGWQIAPAGIEIPLSQDTLPLNLVMHPDGKNLFILNSGYLPPSVVIMNTANPKDAQRISLESADAWLGLALNNGVGDRIYVPEANIGEVQEFLVRERRHQEAAARFFKLLPFPRRSNGKEGARPAYRRPIILGDATVSADGKFLFVANMQHSLIHAIDFANRRRYLRKWLTPPASILISCSRPPCVNST